MDDMDAAEKKKSSWLKKKGQPGQIQRASSTIGSSRSSLRSQNSKRTTSLSSSAGSLPVVESIPISCSATQARQEVKPKSGEDRAERNATKNETQCDEPLIKRVELKEPEKNKGKDNAFDFENLQLLIADTQSEVLGHSSDYLLHNTMMGSNDGVEFAASSTPEIIKAATPEQHIASRLAVLFKRLFDTEALYLRDMQLFLRVFAVPLWEAQILDRKMTMEIVSTTEFIVKVNHDLLQTLLALGDRIVNEGVSIFLRWTKWYKLYCMFCDNYERSFAAISRAKKIPAFKIFWKEVHSNALLNGHEIFSFMSKPLYRVLKYNVIFKEMLATVPTDHPMRGDLEEVMKETNDITTYIMAKRVISSDLQKILSIYYRLTGLTDFELVSTRRRFFREGPLIKLSPKGREQERQFFLFNDVLIYAKRKRLNHDKFLVKGVVPMDIVLIRDYRERVGDVEEKSVRSFQIVRMDIKKVYTIRAKSKAEKEEWMKDLQRIVNQYLKKLQESQKIPQTFDEVVDITVSFLLWGVLPSASSEGKKKPISRNQAFIHQRRPQHLVLPKTNQSEVEESHGKFALNTIYTCSKEAAGSPNFVVQSLLSSILSIFSDYSFLIAEFKEKATACIFLDPRYENFVKATSELQMVNIDGLVGSDRTAFFLNLYHLILIHAHVEMGAPAVGIPRFDFLLMTSYRVGRHTLSLFEIEYHTLRARMTKTDIFGAGNRFVKALKKKNKELSAFELEPDPLLNFAISYLVMASPQVQVFTAGLVERQMVEATKAHISKNMLIKHIHGRVGLPKQFEWNAADFIGRAPPPLGEYTYREVQDLLAWCANHMPGEEGQDIMNLLAVHKTKAELVYFDYDWTFTVSTANYTAPINRSARTATALNKSWRLSTRNERSSSIVRALADIGESLTGSGNAVRVRKRSYSADSMPKLMDHPDSAEPKAD